MMGTGDRDGVEADAPSLFERVAYRALGVRLDDRWRGWVERDLEDPAWTRRHRLAQLGLTAVALALALGAFRVLIGRWVWYGVGGFFGALLGQLAFGELKRAQTRRAQLAPGGGWITGPLPFAYRVVFVVASMQLAFSSTMAAVAMIERAFRPACDPMSQFARHRIDALARDGVAMSAVGVSRRMDGDFVELVARRVSVDRAGTVGTFAVRADGAVIAMDAVGAAAVESDNVAVSFSSTADIEEVLLELRRCAADQPR